MTPYRVLFLCNANACRSIMAEAALNALGGGQFQAYSAGSQPRGEVHPVTLDVLSNAGFTVDGLHSKSWHTFESDDAPHMDLVISVCTATVHLAGALGKPTAVLLSHDPDWRWQRSGERSPWYPTARLYRQQDPDQWAPVVQRLRNDLEDLAAAGAVGDWP